MGEPGRALGVDVGQVRVGLAVSDAAGMLATPLDTLPGGRDLPARIAARAQAEGCRTVVVGLPRGMDGQDNAATGRARQLADQLGRHGLEVALWDERLSSVQAERALLGAGQRRARRREVRDQLAAAIILQAWLDARRPLESRER